MLVVEDEQVILLPQMEYLVEKVVEVQAKMHRIIQEAFH
jgi:hypothetical protein